jgi:Holliday junction resolvasome RuvABC endonuclease subunit
MKIIGLDPAARCGFAHSDGHRGVWELTLASGEHPGARLRRLRTWLYKAKREWGIDLIAYEDAQLGSHDFRTQGLHAELRGLIKLVADEMGEVPLVAVNPITLKVFATGHGKAKKPDMIRAAETFLGIITTDDNVADALWVLEFAKNPKRRELSASPKPKRKGKSRKEKQLKLC